MDDNVYLFPADEAGISSSGNIKDTNIMEFEKDVINMSLKIPVILFISSKMCSICNNLKPIVERLVKLSSTKMAFVNLDIDTNPELSAALQVQNVPTVFAFFQGQPIDGFTGNKLESDIRKFIDKVATLADGENPQAAAMLEQIEQFIEKATEALKSGDWETALNIYMRVLQADDQNIDAVVGVLRSQIAGGHIDEAKAFLERYQTQVDALPVKIKSIRTMLDLIDEAPKQNSEDMAKPQNLEDYYNLAMALFKEGAYGQAIFYLLEIIKKDKKWENGQAHSQLLRMFEALGDDDETTIKGRRQLSSLLFS